MTKAKFYSTLILYILYINRIAKTEDKIIIDSKLFWNFVNENNKSELNRLQDCKLSNSKKKQIEDFIKEKT